MTRAFTADRRRLTGLRLAAQGIAAGVPLATPRDAVAHLLAAQAQDFGGAKWSVGLRVPGSTDADVEAALAAGTIVRSWPMRGTLHLMAAEDLGWMLSLTGERGIRSAAGRHRQLELTDADFARAADIVRAALEGGRVLGRTELLATLDAGGIPTTGQRGAHLLVWLAQSGVTVFGPVDGKQHTFVLLDEWVPSPRVLERDEALGELALRYFTSHGPATERDLAWWSSLTLGDVRAGLAIARGHLDELVVDGTSYYLARDAETAPSGVVALPGFDEYLLGYQDRSAPLTAEHAAFTVPGSNGMFLPTIVVDGEVVGLWKRRVTTKETVVEARPFAPMPARAVARFRAAAERYGEFLGLPARVEEHPPIGD